MSRIIMKNLPSTITEKKLRDLFEDDETDKKRTESDKKRIDLFKDICVTDLQLKYNKAGVFRKFAFVGFKTEDDAKVAREYFDNTYIFSSKIKVEICSNLHDPNKPKPWKEFLKSKVESKEIEHKKKSKSSKLDVGEIPEEKKSKSSKLDVGEIPEELKNDSRFKEFLAVNESRTLKPVWGEDIEVENDSSGYGTPLLGESEHEKSTSEEKQQDLKEEAKIKTKDKSEKNFSNKKTVIYNDTYTVKVRNLPYSCKKKQIKELFQPLKITSLRLPPRSKGFAYVSFKTEKDMNNALNKHRGYLGGKRIDVIKYTVKENTASQFKEKEDGEDKEKDMELLSETGRIFIRNLCYTVAESEIEQLFSKYGPLAEIFLPMDSLTKKAQGFAFVSFVFAEHAIKAFNELDGTIFQGRLLHLIPSRPKKEVVIDENETNFKKKKEAKLKSLSGSSHNWNILFMSMNAVAEVISEKYNVEKSKLLSGDSKESVAVRMALAETQVVMDTRKFLIDNGVELDAFSQPAAERSKTVIVVKHLPARTSSEELYELFSKHGTLCRVILPPSGLAALIEFQNPTEAKSAFKKLAYTRFHHLPLYLEWAPVNAVKDPPPNADDSGVNESIEKEETKSAEQESKDDEEEPPTGTTIFVKNVNFNTTQDKFKKHFEQCGPVFHSTISTKRDTKTGKTLSMGFGFVQYKKRSSALKALQSLQLSKLDDYSLELKFANRATLSSSTTHRKKSEIKKQQSAKILVKNIPFEASDREVRDLFKEFGVLKFLRLPKKMDSDEHRGFGFVEYMTKSDAKRAFETLCHSTHLFGRRLVLEWANPESEDIDELRKKTARDFDYGGRKMKLKKSKLIEDVALASARLLPEDD